MRREKMNLNLKFTGAVEKIIEEAVRKGYAATKSEAIRLGVLELNQKYKLLDPEDETDIARADSIMQNVVEGKEKLHDEERLMRKLK